MKIRLNGKEVDFAGSTVTELLAAYNIRPEKIVVERNGEILHRQAYGTTPIAEGDVLELVRFVGGG